VEGGPSGDADGAGLTTSTGASRLRRTAQAAGLSLLFALVPTALFGGMINREGLWPVVAISAVGSAVFFILAVKLLAGRLTGSQRTMTVVGTGIGMLAVALVPRAHVTYAVVTGVGWMFLLLFAVVLPYRLLRPWKAARTMAAGGSPVRQQNNPSVPIQGGAFVLSGFANTDDYYARRACWEPGESFSSEGSAEERARGWIVDGHRDGQVEVIRLEGNNGTVTAVVTAQGIEPVTS
jgi:hypothetical protein